MTQRAVFTSNSAACSLQLTEQPAGMLQNPRASNRGQPVLLLGPKGQDEPGQTGEDSFVNGTAGPELRPLGELQVGE